MGVYLAGAGRRWRRQGTQTKEVSKPEYEENRSYQAAHMAMEEEAVAEFAVADKFWF